MKKCLMCETSVDYRITQGCVMLRVFQRFPKGHSIAEFLEKTVEDYFLVNENYQQFEK